LIRESLLRDIAALAVTAVQDTLMGTEQHFSAFFTLLRELIADIDEFLPDTVELSPDVRFKAYGHLYELPVAGCRSQGCNTRRGSAGHQCATW